MQSDAEKPMSPVRIWNKFNAVLDFVKWRPFQLHLIQRQLAQILDLAQLTTLIKMPWEVWKSNCSRDTGNLADNEQHGSTGWTKKRFVYRSLPLYALL